MFSQLQRGADRTLLQGVAAMCIWVLTLAGTDPLTAQDSSFTPPPAAHKHDRAPARLLQLEHDLESGSLTGAELRRRCELQSLQLRPDQKIKLEIIGPIGSEALQASQLAGLDVEFVRSWRHCAKVWIPVSSLTEVADALPPGYVIDPMGRVGLDAVEGQGPSICGTEEYRDAGLDGTGVTVAVIDFGYNLLNDSQLASDAPPDSELVKLDATSGASEPDEFDTTGTRHGTGCLENVYDHAPGASYRLYKIDPGSQVDLGFVVADAIAAGVDVITHSISWYNRGWHDNTGPALSANDAGLSDILFFTSAGNRARQHWQGDFQDSDADDLHEFAPGDESIDVFIPPRTGTRFFLQWNTDPGLSDFDLFLFDSSGTLLDSSTNGGEQFEDVSWGTALNPQTVKLQVVLNSGPTTEFEIFMITDGPASWQEHIVEASSTTSPSNATHPNVISVGAVPATSYTSFSGVSGINAFYSSQGPTNDAMGVPDVAAPTNIVGTAYEVFGGTSCATPNAAGVAAVLLSCPNGPGAEQARVQLLRWADCLKDWGLSGKDFIYGYGGVSLPDLQDCWDGDGTPDACQITSGEAQDSNCNGTADSFSCGEVGSFFGLIERSEPYSELTGASEVWVPMIIFTGAMDPGPGVEYAGFSAGVLNPEAGLFPVGVEPGPDLAIFSGGQGPDFFAANLFANSLTLGVVIDFQGNETLLLDEPAVVALMGWSVSPDLLVQDVVELGLEFQDGIGDPPVLNELVTNGGSIVGPMFLNGTVEYTRTPDFRFIAGLPPIESEPEFTVAYDPQTGEPESPELFVPIHVHQEGSSLSPIPTEGFTMTLAHDPSALQITDAIPVGELATLNGGNGPEFFSVEYQPAGIVMQATYGSGQTIEFELPSPVVELKLFIPPVSPNASLTRLIWPTVPGANEIGAEGQAVEVLTAGAAILFEAVPNRLFTRGDFNADLQLAIDDAIGLLTYLFSSGPAPGCDDAADINDDGAIGIADAIILLAYLFQGGPPPPDPSNCGEDPTSDSLDCAESPCP